MKRYVIMTLVFVAISCVALGVVARKTRGAAWTTKVDIAKKKGVIDTVKVKQRKLTKLVKPSGPPPKNTPTLPAPAKASKVKKDSTK